MGLSFGVVVAYALVTVGVTYVGYRVNKYVDDHPPSNKQSLYYKWFHSGMDSRKKFWKRPWLIAIVVFVFYIIQHWYRFS